MKVVEADEGLSPFSALTANVDDLVRMKEEI